MKGKEKISSISSEGLKAFRSHSDEIIRLATQSILKDSEQADAHGEDAEKRISSGLPFTTLALQTALLIRNTKLLDLQIEWANERLPNDKVMPKHLLANLQSYANAVDETLPPEHARIINEYVAWMIERQSAWIAAHR